MWLSERLLEASEAFNNGSDTTWKHSLRADYIKCIYYIKKIERVKEKKGKKSSEKEIKIMSMGATMHR